jgi:hypothetical protein
MPAKSKAQRRIFALALQYKRGELSASEISNDVKELSKLPEETLLDYVKTSEKDLPDYVDEDVNLNPNMNVQSMGNVTLPGNPGSSDSFFKQSIGSGDIETGEKKKKRKKIKLLSFNNFLYEMTKR